MREHLARADAGDVEETIADFERLLALVPNAPRAPAAREKLAALRGR